MWNYYIIVCFLWSWVAGYMQVKKNPNAPAEKLLGSMVLNAVLFPICIFIAMKPLVIKIIERFKK